MPTVAVRWALCPAALERVLAGLWHGFPREFLETGHQGSAGSFCRQPWDGLNGPHGVLEAHVLHDLRFDGAGPAFACPNVGSGERSCHRQSAEGAVSSDAVRGSALDGHASLCLELSTLIDAAHHVSLHGGCEGQPFLEACVEGSVEHNRLEGVDGHQLEVVRQAAECPDVVVGFLEEVRGHAALEIHPVRTRLDDLLGDALLSHARTEGGHVRRFPRSRHGKVGHHGVFEASCDDVTADFCRHRATGAEALWADPIWKAFGSQGLFEHGVNALDFCHGFLVAHWTPVRVRAAAHRNRESVASVIAEANFLMCSSQDLDVDVRHVNTTDFVGRCVDDEELAGDGPLVLGAGEENALLWNAKGLGQSGDEAVGLPVAEGDARDGESAALIHAEFGGEFLNTEIFDPGFDQAANAACIGGVTGQANGFGMGLSGGGHAERPPQRVAPENSAAMEATRSLTTFAGSALPFVRM